MGTVDAIPIEPPTGPMVTPSHAAPSVRPALEAVVTEPQRVAHDITSPWSRYQDDAQVFGVRHGAAKPLSAPAILEIHGQLVAYASAEVTHTGVVVVTRINPAYEEAPG